MGGGRTTPSSPLSFNTKDTDKFALSEPEAQRYVYRLVWVERPHIPVGQWTISVVYTWQRAMRYRSNVYMAATKFVRAGELIYAVESYSDE